jgi:carbamoyltransferase
MTTSEGAEVVLGLSFDFHDSAAALLVDGTIVAAAEEERFTRHKHDAALPEGAVAAILAEACLEAGQIDHVVFYEKPIGVAARFLAAKQRQGFHGYRSFLRDVPRVFGDNLMAGYRIGRMLQRLGVPDPPQAQFLEHHLSHASAAFFASPFEQAAILTIDGIGEWATTTIGFGVRNRIDLLEELRYPDSLGLAYSAVTAYCGFRPNQDEYKLMGLAPYGTPRFADQVREMIGPRHDGSISVDARALGWYRPGGARSRTLDRWFDGPARVAGDPLTQREADLAASVQTVTEEVVLAMAARAHERTGERRICLAGGVALNCVANGRLLREGPFDEVWVQPAAGDAGSAAGCALAYWHLELGHPRSTDAQDAMIGSLLGPAVTDAAARDALDARGVPYLELEEADLVDRVAAELADGAIVGWCRGRMEFGPRALGNRSILADPRSPDVRARINATTKGRESFRPFAPAVLAERAHEWFELDHPSPYMLIVAPVLDAHRVSVDDEPADLGERAAIPRSTIPACTHVDGSARIQTVDGTANPSFRALIERFEARTGCPMVLNTSFNRAEEPIVATADQAIRTGAACEVDLLVVGRCIVDGAALRATLPPAEALEELSAAGAPS